MGGAAEAQSFLGVVMFTTLITADMSRDFSFNFEAEDIDQEEEEHGVRGSRSASVEGDTVPTVEARLLSAEEAVSGWYLEFCSDHVMKTLPRLSASLSYHAP